MKKILLTIIISLYLAIYLAPLGVCEETALDETTKEICNQVMLNIYYELIELKKQYPELAHFDKNTMYENRHGLYTIVYKIEDPTITKQTAPFAFGLTIDRIDDKTFPPQPGSFNFSFPLIGIKFSGYQYHYLRSTQLDILPLIEKYGLDLALYQQKYMPLRLYLKPIKESYKVNEEIEFEVILKNVGKTHMFVRDLVSKNLFFIFNNRQWGTHPLVIDTSHKHKRGGRKKIPRKTLKTGESLNLILRGAAFSKPQEVDIFATYKMQIKGVNPSGLLHIRVEE